MKIPILLSILLIISASWMQSAIAASTEPVILAAPLAGTATVSTNGGNINSTINVDTGALGSAFAPRFTVRSNDPTQKNLTLSVSANTTTGYQNAVFDSGAIRYVILTNSSALPLVASLTDIKNGTLTNNPNAIAYVANNPTGGANVTVTYSTANKNWNLLLSTNTNRTVTFTIPSGAPLSGSYTSDDEVGSYQAIVTLSFNP